MISVRFWVFSLYLSLSLYLSFSLSLFQSLCLHRSVYAGSRGGRSAFGEGKGDERLRVFCRRESVFSSHPVSLPACLPTPLPGVRCGLP